MRRSPVPPVRGPVRALTARADGAYYCLRPAAGVRPVEVRCSCSAPTSVSLLRGDRFFRGSAADSPRPAPRWAQASTALAQGIVRRRLAGDPPCRGRVVRQDPGQAPHVSGRGLGSRRRRRAALRLEHHHHEQKRLWPREQRGRDRRLPAPCRDGIRVHRRDLEQVRRVAAPRSEDQCGRDEEPLQLVRPPRRNVRRVDQAGRPLRRLRQVDAGPGRKPRAQDRRKVRCGLPGTARERDWQLAHGAVRDRRGGARAGAWVRVRVLRLKPCAC